MFHTAAGGVERPSKKRRVDRRRTGETLTKPTNNPPWLEMEQKQFVC